MRILVIRHGESEADLLDVHEGRADFELTKRGHIRLRSIFPRKRESSRHLMIC